MKPRISCRLVLAVVCAGWIWWLPVGFGQSTPVDLTELGIEEILAMPIIREDGLEERLLDGLRFNYEYVRFRFEEYRDGRDRLSVDDVIARGFPTVPKEITQQAHLFSLGYEVTDRLSLTFQIPFIRQETFHVSVIPGFSEFTIHSSGIGDVNLTTSYLAWQRERHYVFVEGGLNLPTGSIDELGPTPRDATRDTSIPYTMQLGSGTVDARPAITYVGTSGWLEWGGRVQGTVRLGRNSRDYSLSDRLALRTWVAYTGWDFLQPSVKVSGDIWSRIDGRDESLIIVRPDGTEFFPAPVTDPNLYGGEKINLLFGLRIPFMRGLLRGQKIEVEGGIPIYQSLNGPQNGEEWRVAVKWNWNF